MSADGDVATEPIKEDLVQGRRARALAFGAHPARNRCGGPCAVDRV